MTKTEKKSYTKRKKRRRKSWKNEVAALWIPSGDYGWLTASPNRIGKNNETKTDRKLNLQYVLFLPPFL